MVQVSEIAGPTMVSINHDSYPNILISSLSRAFVTRPIFMISEVAFCKKKKSCKFLNMPWLRPMLRDLESQCLGSFIFYYLGNVVISYSRSALKSSQGNSQDLKPWRRSWSDDCSINCGCEMGAMVHSSSLPLRGSQGGVLQMLDW